MLDYLLGLDILYAWIFTWWDIPICTNQQLLICSTPKLGTLKKGRYKICSKLTIKTPERCHWQLFLALLMKTLNRQIFTGVNKIYCFILRIVIDKPLKFWSYVAFIVNLSSGSCYEFFQEIRRFFRLLFVFFFNLCIDLMNLRLESSPCSKNMNDDLNCLQNALSKLGAEACS